MPKEEEEEEQIRLIQLDILISEHLNGVSISNKFNDYLHHTLCSFLHKTMTERLRLTEGFFSLG